MACPRASDVVAMMRVLRSVRALLFSATSSDVALDVAVEERVDIVVSCDGAWLRAIATRVPQAKLVLLDSPDAALSSGVHLVPSLDALAALVERLLGA